MSLLKLTKEKLNHYDVTQVPGYITQDSDKDSENKRRHLIACYLSDIYKDARCGFPSWADNAINEWPALLDDVTVYFEVAEGFTDYEQSQQKAEYLAKVREPMNVRMSRVNMFNESKMQELFGWTRGGYAIKSQRLNIGVFTRALFSSGGESHRTMVYNAIGLALDSHTQPDLMKLMEHDITTRHAEVIKFYDGLFHRILTVADAKCSTLFMCVVGTEASFGYSDGKEQPELKTWNLLSPETKLARQKYFEQTVFWPAFRSRLKHHVFENHTPENPLVLRFFHGENYVPTVPDLKKDNKCVTFINNTVRLTAALKVADVNHAMFVNDWNPWTLVGNGNACHKSIDGEMGSMSTMALTTWPVYNKKIQYQTILPPPRITVKAEPTEEEPETAAAAKPGTAANAPGTAANAPGTAAKEKPSGAMLAQSGDQSNSSGQTSTAVPSWAAAWVGQNRCLLADATVFYDVVDAREVNGAKPEWANADLPRSGKAAMHDSGLYSLVDVKVQNLGQELTKRIHVYSAAAPTDACTDVDTNKPRDMCLRAAWLQMCHKLFTAFGKLGLQTLYLSWDFEISARPLALEMLQEYLKEYMKTHFLTQDLDIGLANVDTQPIWKNLKRVRFNEFANSRTAQEMVSLLSDVQLGGTLFVNFAECTFDGWLGQNSTLALTSSRLANANIKYDAVAVLPTAQAYRLVAACDEYVEFDLQSVLNTIQQNPKLLEDVTVYYDQGAIPAAVRKVATQREPANKDNYSTSRMEKFFGYIQSPLGDGGMQPHVGVMHPHVGVYSKTVLLNVDSDVKIHVYSTDLDAPNVASAMAKIVHVATTRPFKTLVMSFGQQGEHYIDNFLLPAFMNSLLALQKPLVLETVKFLNGTFNREEERTLRNGVVVQLRQAVPFEEFFKDKNQSSILYVNVCDSKTIIGMGAMSMYTKTTLALTTWPLFNPNIKYAIVPVPLASESLVARATALRECYLPDNRFQEWTIQHVANNRDLLANATVFYDIGDDVEEVQRLASEREPTHVGEESMYKKDKLLATFGYNQGRYGLTKGTYDASKRLNIGILAKTAVKVDAKVSTVPRTIWVYNAVPLDFSSLNQPDTVWLKSLDASKRRQKVIDAYERIFGKMLAAAVESGLTTVIMSLIGTDAATIRYYSDTEITAAANLQSVDVMAFQKHVFLPALTAAFESFTRFAVGKSHITMRFIGQIPHDITKRVAEALTSASNDEINVSPDLDNPFPECLQTMAPTSLQKTMFVNGIGPWSIAGNANNDKTLDGRMGMHSTLALTTWPYVNTQMRYQSVMFDPPHRLAKEIATPDGARNGWLQSLITVDFGKNLKKNELMRDSLLRLLRVQSLLQLLPADHKFPMWTIAYLERKHGTTPEDQRYEVEIGPTVYYDSNCDLKAVKSVVERREPCNRSMTRCYDQDDMYRAFGYRTGSYGEPRVNFGVCVLVRAKLTESASATSFHVYNAVALQLDDVKQPDYKWLMSMPPGCRIDRLRTEYRKMFEKIIYCCRQQFQDTVVMPPVGLRRTILLGGEQMPQLEFVQKVWAPAFAAALRARNSGITLTFRFMEPEVPGLLAAIKSEMEKFTQNTFVVHADALAGTFPALLGKPDMVLNTMFVNDWNPWTVVGNGFDANDTSVDTLMGRYTTVALGTWPEYCFEPKYEKVPVTHFTDAATTAASATTAPITAESASAASTTGASTSPSGSQGTAEKPHMSRKEAHNLLTKWGYPATATNPVRVVRALIFDSLQPTHDNQLLENAQWLDMNPTSMQDDVFVFCNSTDMNVDQAKVYMENQYPVHAADDTVAAKVKKEFGLDPPARNRQAPNLGVMAFVCVPLDTMEFIMTNVYSTHGLAFDNTTNADFKWLTAIALPDRAAKVKARYEAIFDLMFRSAAARGHNTLVMSLVGATSLAAGYEDATGSGPEHFQLTVWAPALQQSAQTHAKNRDLQIYLMGTALHADLVWSVLIPAGESKDCFHKIRIDLVHDPSGALAMINSKGREWRRTLFVNELLPGFVAGVGPTDTINAQLGKKTSLTWATWAWFNIKGMKYEAFRPAPVEERLITNNIEEANHKNISADVIPYIKIDDKWVPLTGSKAWRAWEAYREKPNAGKSRYVIFNDNGTPRLLGVRRSRRSKGR